MRQTLYRRIPILGLLALAGCTSVKALEGPPSDLRTLYDTALSGPLPRLSTHHLSPSSEDPLPTLLQPPQIHKVWLPAQRTPEGDLVAGHWTYLLLEPPQWRLDPPATPGLPLAPLPSAALPVPQAPPGATPLPRAGAPRTRDSRGTSPATLPLAPAWSPGPGEAP